MVNSSSTSSILKQLQKNWYPFTVVSLLFVIFYSANLRKDVIKSHFNRVTKSMPSPTRTISYNAREMKYILLWTNPKNTPFNYFGEGRNIFLRKGCAYTNCYVTSNRNFLGDYTEFEVIAFNGPELNEYVYMNDLPKRRSERQKYVYANIESASIYPVCSKMWNNYFNWTWTYKLDSSAIWGYFIIRDRNNRIVGPKLNMHWINQIKMDPIDDNLKVLLLSKTTPIAWFVSNCDSDSRREIYVKHIQAKLSHYNIEIDIYGTCGNLQCPKSITDRCFKMLEKKYFFYLAFENSLSEDYVTEKVLNAMQHNTVPIVFGGANYTRFLPKGSYLDALKMGPKKLAEEVHRILHSIDSEYFKFFQWKKYYSYHKTNENPDGDVYCRFCEMLNDKAKMNTKTVYPRFSDWWSSEQKCHDKSK
ncbi:alpha-(1,3)-fucosyltransferase C-like [Aricia agestis]|uniref:alpha-(1,3)-fucosyltransferase C-like n=1 Tax=Aricia agestis TaxID=91739 RepID=UPI001C209262|nr:alpha-(1,3)-fucosyltransferase C-like [Aricia agestis]